MEKRLVSNIIHKQKAKREQFDVLLLFIVENSGGEQFK